MDPKGFLSSLVDTSFTHLISTKLVRWFFIIGAVLNGALIGLFAVASILGALSEGFLYFIGALIVVPILTVIFYGIWLIGFRIFCELLIVIFRIAETMHSIDGRLARSASEGPVSGAL